MYDRNMAGQKHFHHHSSFISLTTIKRHYFSLLIALVFLILVFLGIFRFISPLELKTVPESLSFSMLFWAVIATLNRLFVAYVLAIIFAIPLALLAVAKPRLEVFLLPFFDILQSVPVLAFFPLIVLVFVKVQFFEGAAIFVLFVAMLWNLVFSIIAGLKTIPADIHDAAFVFHARGWKKLFYVVLPAIFPYLVTGSLLAWAQGWNIIIVAEVLHNYIPNNLPSQDLEGLGSLLVNAGTNNQNDIFLAGIIVLVVLIATINYFVWQKLLKRAERYKFD